MSGGIEIGDVFKSNRGYNKLYLINNIWVGNGNQIFIDFDVWRCYEYCFENNNCALLDDFCAQKIESTEIEKVINSFFSDFVCKTGFFSDETVDNLKKLFLKKRSDLLKKV